MPLKYHGHHGMARKDYTTLTAAGVRALWERRKFTQRDLAEKVGIPTSSINRILQGTQPVTLKVLEAVGELTNTNPLELLLDPDEGMKLVTPIESQLLRQFRGWPAPTRLALLTFLSLFADELPAVADERRAHEQIRRLAENNRRLVYAYLTFLTEGGLPPDVRKALGLPETDETQSGYKTPPPTKTKAKKKQP